MMSVIDLNILLILLAVLLDLIIGDPVYPFHPIRIIGNYIIRPQEQFFFRSGSGNRLDGLVMVVLTLLVVWGGVFFLDSMLITFPFFYALLNLYLLYSCIAIRDLGRHIDRVVEAMADGDLHQARKALQYVVGRETDNMDETAVTTACVETLAENLSDGIIAPVFYAFLGGAPLALAYKAVNTMDSMVGYKNERYGRFGFFPAKCDDVLNWIPARISFLLILLVGACSRSGSPQSWKTAWVNRRRHASPNSGYPEAAMAAVLNVRMGGANRYHGKVVEKPVIHPEGLQAGTRDVKDAWRLTFVAGLLSVFAFTLIRLLLANGAFE